ncbi:uncharacterized protein DMENIID0001_045940 [Sergentomyia squamirostris]
MFHKILKAFLKGYFMYIKRVDSVSQTHGVHHILNEKLHPIERLFWVSLVISAFSGGIVIAHIQWIRYIANPTVISLERDYHDWNGTMPGVTFCYEDRLNSEAVDAFLEAKWNITPLDDEYSYFASFVEAIVNVSVLDLNKFDEFSFDDRLREVDFLDITKMTVPILEQHISNFDRGIHLEAIPIITEKGLCYSINSPLAHLLSIAQTNPNPKDFGSMQPTLSCKFTKNQCYLKIEVYGDRLSAIYVHSPFELPLGESRAFALESTEEVSSTYKVVETTADVSLRDLSPKQRKCLFYDEPIRELPFYSVNLCTMECRATAALSICGCKPFFYPFIPGPQCGIDGMFCLNRILWLEQTKGMCECPKPCLDLVYIENSVKIESWDVAVDGIPFAQKSTIRLKILPPRMRHRREVMFTFEDLLVSYGAAMTLFIGTSFYNLLQGTLIHFEFFYDIIRWCWPRRRYDR